MSESFSLVDHLAVSDLQVYLSRAGRVENGSVRMIAANGVLAVYTAIIYPHGLMDRGPTVLGLRTFATDAGVDIDAVVPMRSLLDRLVRLQGADGESTNADGLIGIRMPLEVSTVTWAGISPPRSGWLRVGQTTDDVLDATAAAGIAEVAAAVPTDTGEQLVQRVRAEVWGRPIEGLVDVPAGVAFAATTLGFLGDDGEIPIFESGPWSRLTTKRGHVLVRRPPWTLRL